MNRFIQYISLTISLLALILIVCMLTGKIGQQKIAYIRSTDLVYGYLGMQEAHNEYEVKSKTWKSNTDTLQQEFQRSLEEYRMKEAKLSKVEKEATEKKLEAQKQHIIGYMKTASEQAKAEDEKITQSVLNQVNSFVEDYGKKHDYKVILGTTASGNLLYGEEGIDITKEVLEALNKNYKGEELTTN